MFFLLGVFIGFLWLFGVFSPIGTFFTGFVFGEIFLFGTFWFWALVAAMSAGVIWLIDEGESGDLRGSGTYAPLALFLVVAVVLQCFGDIHVFSYIGVHPYKSFLWMALYIVCGAMHSLGRWGWFLFVHRPAKYRDAKEKFFRLHALTNEIPDHLKYHWDVSVFTPYAKKVSSWEYKSWLIALAAYWPWSLFWFLVSDLVKKLFRYMYEILQQWYDRIAEVAWRRMDKEVSQIKFAPENKDREEKH